MERAKASVATHDRDTELDFGALSRGIGRSKRWIVLGTLMAFGLAYLFVVLVKPRYTAEAKVLLEYGETYFTRPEKETPLQPALLDPEAVESQVQLVTSRDLARRAVQKLRLIGNPEFDPMAAGQGPLTRMLILLGLQRDPAKMSAEDRVLEVFYEKLLVYPVAKTRVLSIQFTSVDPELAARAANEVASLYLGMQEDAKKSSAKSASTWLAPQIDSLRGKVAEADAKVEAFRSRSGLLVGNNNTTFSAQQVADLTTQLSTARAVSADRSAKAKLIRGLVREGRVSDISDVANNELIRNIAQQRVTLRSQLALESRTLLPGHPHIQELTAQLADVDAAMRTAAEKTARGFEIDARAASARVKELSSTIDAQKETVAAGNGDEVELRALQRDAASARDQLESFMQKYRAAVALEAANAASADARVISKALAPQLPSFPKTVPTLVIATLAGFFLTLGLCTTRELFSGAAWVPVRRHEDALDRAPLVRQNLAADPPVLAAVPTPVAVPAVPVMAPVTPVAAMPVAAVPLAPATADTMLRLPGIARARDAIVAAKADAKACCIVVAGLERRVETEAAAIALARELAARGRAILVDFDDAGQGFVGWLAPGETAGLAELVGQRKSFAEVIHRDTMSSLHIVPAGTAATDDPHAVDEEEERLDLVIDALEATYDYVVLVVQPVAAGDTVAHFATWTSLAVLVCEGSEDDQATLTAAETLRRSAVGPVLVVSTLSLTGSGQAADRAAA